jgi:hypothetical protein
VRAKASEGSTYSIDVNNPAATRGLVLGMHSAPGQTVIHAKASLPSKVKAPISTTHLSQAGKSSSKMGLISFMGGKYDSKETVSIPFSRTPSQAELTIRQASGLHVPSVKDVAPFSGNKLVVVKEPNPKNRVLALEKDSTAHKKPGPKKKVSFALEDEDTTPGSLVAEGDRSDQLKSGVRVMTNNESISVSRSRPFDLPSRLFPPPNNVALRASQLVRCLSQHLDNHYIHSDCGIRKDTDVSRLI